MKEQDGYYIWTKGETASFNQYFSANEFSCQCTHPECKEQKVVVTLIDKLRVVRENLKLPMKIHSGYRCHAHQDDLRASGLETSAGISTHEMGKAADVSADDMNRLGGELEKQFTAMGTAKSFYHVDLRAGVHKWSYLRS